MVEFRLFLTELSARNTSVFYFQDNNLSKSQWIFTKFDVSIDIVENCFGIAQRQIPSVSDRLICACHDKGGVLSFQVYLAAKLACSSLPTDKALGPEFISNKFREELAQSLSSPL